MLRCTLNQKPSGIFPLSSLQANIYTYTPTRQIYTQAHPASHHEPAAKKRKKEETSKNIRVINTLEKYSTVGLSLLIFKGIV